MTADYLIDSGTAVIGSPKTVRAKIEEVRDKTGLGILLPMFQFGILSDELARRSIEMFASEVMPQLRG
jgi:alkanesulfonate monooxygenase SsuD/methylene tetrahydromethanopterin reductase-like flavin-dependent oxidoreductase (luciferase family)